MQVEAVAFDIQLPLVAVKVAPDQLGFIVVHFGGEVAGHGNQFGDAHCGGQLVGAGALHRAQDFDHRLHHGRRARANGD